MRLSKLASTKPHIKAIRIGVIVNIENIIYTLPTSFNDLEFKINAIIYKPQPIAILYPILVFKIGAHEEI